MSQSGAVSTSGSGSAGIETLTGNSGGAVGPDGAFNIDVVGNNSTGINIVGTPASSLVTVIGLASSTTQVGTIEIATAVETGTLTDTTRAVSPAGLEPILVTPFVVATGGAYTTIQSALDAANTAGGGVVYIRPGTYTEDLTLYDGVDLVGSSSPPGTLIQGTHTPPASGELNIKNLEFSDATAIFSSAAAGTTDLLVFNCEFTVTGGYVFDLDNWTGTISINNCIGNQGSNNGGVNNTGGASLVFNNSTLGKGTSNSFIASGLVIMSNCSIGCPMDFQTGSIFQILKCSFSSITFSNNSLGTLDFASFVSSTNASITMSSSGPISVNHCTMDSSHIPCIDGSGAGTLSLSNISFLNNASIAGTLTLGSVETYPINMANGELLIGSAGQPATASTLTAGSNIAITNGAGSITIAASTQGQTVNLTAIDNTDSPYTVLSTDYYLSCNVNLGVLTVNLPDAGSAGRVIVIKDSGGDAASNNITVTTVSGTDTIDGATTFVMNTAYEAASFIDNGTSWEVF